ncbi:MAG: rhomboid family intramembrane serine protease [Rhizobacter sp.]|nr:rhomboid family intramembrane serine protease [Rhizobacter sp.]
MDPLSAQFSINPASMLLLVTIVAGSLVALYRVPALLERNLFRPYWYFRRREFPTLVTSAFFHADLAHLFFNAFTFWAFAFALERQIGTPKFVALYAFGLLASGAGTWFKHRHQPDYRTLGASGAILAVLFASIVYTPTASIYILPIPVPIPAPVFAFAYLAFTYYASRRTGGHINHDAHLSGALAGLAFVVLVDPAVVSRAISHVFG